MTTDLVLSKTAVALALFAIGFYVLSRIGPISFPTTKGPPPPARRRIAGLIYRPVSASSLAWVVSPEGAVRGPNAPADLHSSALPFRSA